jgi:hypothetical protein
MRMRRITHHSRPIAGALLAIVLLGLNGTGQAFRGGKDPDRASDRAARDTDRASDRATRDTERLNERAARDTERYHEEREKILREAREDPERAAEKLQKLEEDRAEELAEAQEEAAEIAEEAAEEAAEALEEAAEELEFASRAASGSTADMRQLSDHESPDFDPDGFPVKRGEVSALDLHDDALAKAQAQGFGLISRDDLTTLQSTLIRLSVPSGLDGEKALQALRAIDPSATFDYVHYYGQPYLPQGKASRGGKEISGRKKAELTIGMIDSAVVSHKALNGVSITQRDFSNTKAEVPVVHGTAVASILARDGAAVLYIANVFKSGPKGTYTSADVIVRALDWMAGTGVPVISMSFAGPRNDVLDRLVQKVTASGKNIVAAAGNGGPTAPPAYPAALPSVVAVTAVDSRLRVYRYANQGSYITVAALGVNENAAQAAGGYGSFSGTSYATPHVASWIARCQKSESASACRTRLAKSTKDLGAPGRDPVYGYGYLSH